MIHIKYRQWCFHNSFYSFGYIIDRSIKCQPKIENNGSDINLVILILKLERRSIERSYSYSLNILCLIRKLIHTMFHYRENYSFV